MTSQSKRNERDIIEDMLYELKKADEVIDRYGLPDITKFKKLNKELLDN